MLSRDSGPGWRFPVGASLCGVGGVGSPMPMDFLGGHTLGSATFSAVAVGLFIAATVWMFRRWGDAGAGAPVTLAEDESEAIWAEFEEQIEREPITVSDTASDPAEDHELV